MKLHKITPSISKIPHEFVLDHGITILSPSDEELDKIKTDLTFDNPAYASVMRYSKWSSTNVNPYLTYYHYSRSDHSISVPIGYDVSSVVSGFSAQHSYDCRVSTKIDNLPDFCLELKDDQKSAAQNYIFKNRAPLLRGLIQLPTGKGKSILGLYLARYYECKTLIVVHKDDLVKVWKDDIAKAFNNKTTAGLIKAQSKELGHFITIATIQTLNRLSQAELRKLYNTFGFVIQDECFPKGTIIDGSDISSVKIGDYVNTYNSATKSTEKRKVLNTFKSIPNSIVVVKLSNGEEITCTGGHPFYVNGTYIPAIMLKKGYELHCLSERVSSNRVWVESVEIQKQTSDGTFGGLCPDGYVYNIETENNHNYFVNNVLVHNCHHCPATSFGLVSNFNSRYKLGLTATPERTDGLTHIMFLYFGDFAYKYSRSTESETDILPVKVIKRVSNIYFDPLCKIVEVKGRTIYKLHDLYCPLNHVMQDNEIRLSKVPYLNRPQLSFHDIDTFVVTNEDYKMIVCNDILVEYSKGHSCVAFFSQKEHCRIYYEYLKSHVGADHITLYYGDNKHNEESLELADKNRQFITLTTYSKATEGTNVKNWEVEFLVSSINNAKNTEQAVGRIRRTKEGKINPALLYDYRTPFVYSFGKHGDTRDQRYRALNFDMGTRGNSCNSRGLFKRGY